VDSFVFNGKRKR